MIACCLLSLLLPVLWSIFKCASWVTMGVAPLAVLQWTTSAKTSSVWAEWHCHSGCAPIEPSETPLCRNTLLPVSIPCIAFHIPLEVQFGHCFSLFRSRISNEHSGIVGNCNHTSEWVHIVHPCIRIAMQWVMLQKSLLVFLLPGHKKQFFLD